MNIHSVLKIAGLGLALLCFVACQPDKKQEKISDKTNENPADTLKKISSSKPEDLITTLYEALNKKDYETAYQLWENDGKASDLTFDEFVEGYKNTVKAEVKFTGDVEVHGAAGSRYAEVPVRIEAQLKTGEQQIFTGIYVLRKSNINPEETPNRWHIYEANLKQK